MIIRALINFQLTKQGATDLPLPLWPMKTGSFKRSFCRLALELVAPSIPWVSPVKV